jgi:hypothetical protein
MKIQSLFFHKLSLCTPSFLDCYRLVRPWRDKKKYVIRREKRNLLCIKVHKSNQAKANVFYPMKQSRVSDRHRFNADPDTDPDPAFFLIADPDSGSGSKV